MNELGLPMGLLYKFNPTQTTCDPVDLGDLVTLFFSSFVTYTPPPQNPKR